MQMSFGWIFALIVGAFILFLAIFIAVKLTKTEQASSDAQLSKDIGILLNPLEIGFESAKTTFLDLGAETRIYNGCNKRSYFGRQTIRTSQKSFGEWSETYIDVSFLNKYLFSENPVQGKKFYLFLKPFEFPFKVADLIYITSADKTYCFVDAPENIVQEISDLKQANLVNEININNCPTNSVEVCFRRNCDIRVNYNGGIVTKQGETLSFEGDALMYGAIFSDPDVYNCQTSRLMKRISQLALLYDEKAQFIRQKNCNTNVNLNSLISSANSFSGNFNSINYIVEDIKTANSRANCKLW